MAENTDADLLVQLGMTMTKMNRQLAQAEARFNRTAQKIERDFNRANQSSVEKTVGAATKMEGACTKLGRVAGAVLGVVIGQGILQIAGNAGKAIKSLADLADQADRVGSSLADFQGLQFGFQLSGVDNPDFVRGMETFTQRLGEAAEGTTALGTILRENGVALRDQAGNMRPVNDLLRDFADLVSAAGSEAEQMAMLNEGFGRAGRELRLAMEGGAAGLDQMVQSAREAGVILDDEVIRRAAELDDEIDILIQKAKVFGQEWAVTFGESAQGWAMLIEDIRGIGAEIVSLEDIISRNRMAASALGIEIVDAMAAAGTITDDQIDTVNALNQVYYGLSDQVAQFATDMEWAAVMAEQLGRTAAADALRDIAAAVVENDKAFREGRISAEDLNTALTRMGELAGQVLGPLRGIEGANFDSASESVARFAMALYDAAVQAATLRDNLPTYTPTMPTGGPGTFAVGDNSGDFNSPTPTAPTNVTLPPNRPGDIDFGYSPATGGGSPGGGGTSGGDQGRSPWFTDEQEQQILDAYDALKQAQEDYNQSVEDGAMVVADLFTSVIDGSKSAEEAIADLLAQLAQVQIQKAFLGLAEGGGIWGSLFSSLGGATSTPSLSVPSFDGGGYTGSGARAGGMDGKGGQLALLHPNETVIDHTKSGGASAGGQVSVVVRMEGGNLVPVIESVSGGVTAKAMASYDRQLPGRVRSINSDRRRL